MTVLPLQTLRNRDLVLIQICPSSVLAFMAVISLLLVQWIGALAALGFLVSGLALVVRRPQTMLSEVWQYWMVLTIPFWCLLTVLWSTYPSISLRAVIQLIITFGIAISMANRMSPRAFLRMIFLAHAIVAVLSLLFGQIRADGMGWLGIFGSKNAFAAVMSLFVLVSFAMVLDRLQGWLWRLAAGFGLALGGMLLVLAQSSGALLTTAMALMFGLLLMGARWMTPIQRVIAVGLGLLAALAVAVMLFTLQDVIFSLLLETTGKDATLTGRTDLWQRAFDEIARNPLFGQGYQAVWVEGNQVAEDMWAEFGIANKSGFNFHNTYISNAVEIGIIGVALQAAVLFGATGLTVFWALRDPRAETVFLAILMLRVLMLSMVEVVGLTQFDLGTVVVLCALVFGMRARRAFKAQEAAARLPPRPDPVRSLPAAVEPEWTEDGSGPRPA